MNIDIPKGKYVVGVSGGVDSMVLLDILVKCRAEVEKAEINHPGLKSGLC